MRANAVSESQPEKQMAVEGHLELDLLPIGRTVLTKILLKDTVSEAFSVSILRWVGDL